MKNKVVLITGASSGIGKATVKKFAQNGANIIVAARRISLLNRLKDEISDQFKVDIFPLQLDVTDIDTVNEISNLPEQYKNIDVLVNNAGGALGLEPLWKGDISDWDQMIDTNIKGLLYVTKAVLPAMIKRKTGIIINIASIAGIEAYPGGNVYCAVKSAARMLSKTLRMDLVNTGIKVTAIDPGLVKTDFSKIRFHGDNKRAEKVYENITPLYAEDIADAIYYCATRPSHVDIEEMVIMPTAQASVLVDDRKG